MEESALDKKIKAAIEEARAMEKKPESEQVYIRRPTFLDTIKTKEQAELFMLVMKSLH